MRPAVRAAILAGFSRLQRVLDGGFASAGFTTLAGSGIGTTAVTGGALVVVSTSATYTILPATQPALLEPGVYSTTYTISGYVSGGIGICWADNAAFTSPVDGAARTADGTYTESMTLTRHGFIGLRGVSGVVSSMTIDNLSITRVS